MPRHRSALPNSMNRSSAETIALQALAFLAGAPEALHHFVAVSGADAASLRQRAAEPEFLSAVLNYLLANEDLLIQFCAEHALAARTVHLAGAQLGGDI
jgi:Protein of unknown function (DUF3572)